MRLDKGQIEVIDDIMVEVFRRKSPRERIAIGFGMWMSARKMVTIHLKTSHPDWNELRIQQEVARRLSHGTV